MGTTGSGSILEENIEQFDSVAIKQCLAKCSVYGFCDFIVYDSEHLRCDLLHDGSIPPSSTGSILRPTDQGKRCLQGRSKKELCVSYGMVDKVGMTTGTPIGLDHMVTSTEKSIAIPGLIWETKRGERRERDRDGEERRVRDRRDKEERERDRDEEERRVRERETKREERGETKRGERRERDRDGEERRVRERGLRDKERKEREIGMGKRGGLRDRRDKEERERDRDEEERRVRERVERQREERERDRDEEERRGDRGRQREKREKGERWGWGREEG
ncbi:zinc finger CCCH domain-containing protein 13-like [Haliotis rufescens]|uniref:zinc finger CCCH domain-containing protein 13-like n=1 Tax=Haliotis rufescens TaxID=6454 RepID=UPI00201F78AB|nr:zinc finger CCCH domain-containing protein 13-like [Haliotis rufescens]